MNIYELFSELQQNKFKLDADEHNAKVQINTVIDALSRTDPEIRDKTAYKILCQWFLVDDTLSTAQKKYIYTCVSNPKYLFKDIDRNENDAVFQRSFYMLAIALLLSNNKHSEYLQKQEVEILLVLSTEMLVRESDMRSFVEGKGWAHCIAHTADALDEIVLQKDVTLEDVMYILECIKTFYATNPIMLTGEEDERLSTILLTAIKRNLISYDVIKQWLLSQDVKASNQFPEIRRINLKQFTQSLLIKLSIQGYEIKFNEYPILTRYI